MDEELFESNAKIKVLVTGASGYIALHCVQQLLKAGYSVKGTVRSLLNHAKVDPLRALEYSRERLELVEANLEYSEHWPSVCDGCDYILHVASPWPIVADERTIEVAVNGTMNVFRAAANYKKIKKIVLTSSCAAINDGHRNNVRVFDETCWSNLASDKVENYARSKTLAERAAWDFWHQLDDSKRFQLTVLNPTFVVGPVLCDQQHGSATVISRMMDFKTFLAAPNVSLGMVDVRDVALAHLKAMTLSETDGKRILITSTPSVWFAQVLKWLRKEFSSQGYNITPFVAPDWLFRLYAKMKLDAQAESIQHRVGPELRYNNSLSLRLLQLDYIRPEDSIIEMVYSMIDYGMIKKASKIRLKHDDRKRSNCIII